MISIVIPTLNEEKILERTLSQLRTCTVVPYEIIVSDGRSTDRTIEIAKHLAHKVMVYEGVKRQTIGMGRNLGASVAEGDFLLFLDADMTVPNPDTFFPQLLSHFEKNPKLVAATVYLKIFPEMATWSDKLFSQLFNWMVRIENNFLHVGASSGEFQCMKRNAFEMVHGFDERLVGGEDFDLFHRLTKVGETRTIPTLTVFHTGRRVHKVGWPKLLLQWFMNWFHATFFKSSWITEWEEIR